VFYALFSTLAGKYQMTLTGTALWHQAQDVGDFAMWNTISWDKKWRQAVFGVNYLWIRWVQVVGECV
jgi:ABC-type transport system involved in Fe-S cluster assembly fused permease/ATPase subunit